MGTIKLTVHKRHNDITKISILPDSHISKLPDSPGWSSGHWVSGWDLCEIAADLVRLAIKMQGASLTASALHQRADEAAAVETLLNEICAK